MDKREQAFKDYKKGMKYKDIAEKYEVTESCVKSWAARYWNKQKDKGKVATDNKKSRNQKSVKSQPKSRGAPKGNKNALGNNGGAPLGNTNALKHGGYSQIYWDTLDEEEQELILTAEQSEEDLLLEQIRLFTVRERRLMKAINKYRQIEREKSGLAVSGVITSHQKRSFLDDDEGKAEREQYNALKQEKIEEGKISYLGFDKYTQTTTEAAYNIILRLERELTAVQSKKTKCIEALAKLHAGVDNDNDRDLIEDWISGVEECSENE